MKLSSEGQRLHVFYVSMVHTAHHLVLDAESGRTLSEHRLETQSVPGEVKNAKAVEGGYYEVVIAPVAARYVRLVALSEINGRGWTSIAELQVIGADGKNLPRDRWKVHKVDGYEKNARMGAAPRNAIDNDPVTWWHTPWKDGIPPHPHEIQIDLGSQKKITGIRYLPAVIVNNNGMIKDYELYVSSDGKNWGAPSAKGILVNRIRVYQGQLSGKAILFESRGGPRKNQCIFRYSMDGKPARLIQENARLISLRDSYYVTAARNEKNEEVLSVHRVDDDAYRFELGSTRQFDPGLIEIADDRLFLGRRGVLVADLAKKRFIVGPGDNKQKYNQNGMVLREGTGSLLKIIHRGNQGQEIFRFDLRSGERTEYVLADQVDPFQDRRRQQQSIQQFDGVLLLNDNSAVTAWVAAGD